MEFAVLKQKVTKDFILSKINQESIMQHYLGIDINSKKLFLSPFRNDHKVTCAYYKSKSGVLYIHDFATNEHLSCFNVVMRLYNCNYYQALDKIAKDFGLIKGQSSFSKKIKIVKELKETESSKIQVQIKDFTEEELNWWKSFGITSKILKKYHVYSIQNVFINGELKFTSIPTNPIYGYYFGKDKNKEEKWKLYFPFRTDYRFLGNLTQKILQGYQQLPKTGELLVINKSMKDTMALFRLGIASVSPNSETTFPNSKQIEEFKSRFKNILVMFDNDRAGKINLAKIRRLYPDLNYYCLDRKLGAKDLTDLIKLLGFNQVQELVKEFLIKYKFK